MQPNDAPTPQEVFGGLLMLFMAFVMASGLWFAWAMVAPRSFNGHGSIPDGCGPVTHMLEIVMGPAEPPVCLRPGTAPAGTH